MRVKKWNDSGALEGLPLYLIILVVITAVAIVAILAWMPSNVVLNTITAVGPESDGSILDSWTAADGSIICTAYSTKGDPMEGVSFVIEGPNNAVGTGLTGADGTIEIDLNDSPTLPPNTNVGQLDVEASYEGILKTTTIPVING